MHDQNHPGDIFGKAVLAASIVVLIILLAVWLFGSLNTEPVYAPSPDEENNQEEGVSETETETDKERVLLYTHEIEREDRGVGVSPKLEVRKKVNDGDSEVIAIVGGDEGIVLDYALTSDRQELIVNLKQKIVRVDLATGEQTELLATEGAVTSMALSPDESRLVAWTHTLTPGSFGEENDPFKLFEVNLTSGETAVLEEGEIGHPMTRMYWRPNNTLLLVQGRLSSFTYYTYTFESGSLEDVDLERSPFSRVSRDGVFVANGIEEEETVCNQYSGLVPTAVEIRSTITGEVVNTLTVDEGAHLDLIAFTDDASSFIFSASDPVGNDRARCDERAITYYEASVKTNDQPKQIDASDSLMTVIEISGQMRPVSLPIMIGDGSLGDVTEVRKAGEVYATFDEGSAPYHVLAAFTR